MIRFRSSQNSILSGWLWGEFSLIIEIVFTKVTAVVVIVVKVRVMLFIFAAAASAATRRQGYDAVVNIAGAEALLSAAATGMSHVGRV